MKIFLVKKSGSHLVMTPKNIPFTDLKSGSTDRTKAAAKLYPKDFVFVCPEDSWTEEMVRNEILKLDWFSKKFDEMRAKGEGMAIIPTKLNIHKDGTLSDDSGNIFKKQ